MAPRPRRPGAITCTPRTGGAPTLARQEGSPCAVLPALGHPREWSRRTPGCPSARARSRCPWCEPAPRPRP
eukprot:5772426-Pyramimonas_sp.AAC.1